MKKEVVYKDELKNICKKMQESFAIKINMISALKTSYYLRRLIKLNKRTKNEHIEQLIYIIGNTKQLYKKYCDANNYISDPYVNEKIKEAYIKLSKKSIDIKTKKRNIKNNKEFMQIEYNSKNGAYQINYLVNGEIKSIKKYKMQNIKQLGAKRKKVLDRLTKLNYGINIFKELNVSEQKFYKVNPDIIHIFLEEGKIDYAKMYIKEVVGGETMNLPFGIKYVLNKNMKKGVFSVQENKAMKKMAKADRIANKLIFCRNKKKKENEKLDSSLNKYSKLETIENIKRNVKIANIKEKVDKRKNAEILEIMDRNEKIQNLIEKKKFRDRLSINNPVGTISKYGCKIYNIDRRNNVQNNNVDIAEGTHSNCKIYNIDRRKNNVNHKKSVAYSVVHSER